ncbi:MAG TPA: translation initiation factor IF-1 [Chloroflexia bacterium]|nr:translation initiation factor IF-1 [Chloroflexia bacterium]
MSEKSEAIRVEGRVDEPAPNDTWIVRLDSGHMVTARLSDKLRMLPVRIIPGDRVAIELAPYDLTRGRIVERIRQMK